MYDLTQEVNKIGDNSIRTFVKELLDIIPSHFWDAPSSSTGKYHPPDEHTKGGLVLHTQRVCKAAEVLMRASFPPIEMDVIRASCILHDTARFGLDEKPSIHSLGNHAELAAAFIEKEGAGRLDVSKIQSCVKRHMGKWGKEPPETKEEWIVHLADMVASQYMP